MVMRAGPEMEYRSVPDLPLFEEFGEMHVARTHGNVEVPTDAVIVHLIQDISPTVRG
jgi:hypothetical protein